MLIQAILSLRLIRANTAFQDEALYLWAGHREWAHLLHGASVPPYPSYFSGAPVSYPLFGALADSIGGLSAARILSLIFMLGATGLLWSTTRLLYGRTAAFFAAMLFAVLGPTLHLGSFATYDAMSVFLVALSAWCVVRAAGQRDATGWMIAAGVALALANATAYSIAIFDPVVVVLALLVAMPAPGGKRAVGRGAILAAVVIVLLGIGLLIGGSGYRAGFDSTTLQRAPGADPASTIFTDSWAWTGAVLVLALLGVVISLSRQPRSARSWLPLLLTAAIVAVPAEQASLHTLASLNKHGTMGAWFAAIAAGYAIDAVVTAAAAGASARARQITFAACTAALALPAALGVAQARTFATSWPNSTSFTAIFGPLVHHTPAGSWSKIPRLPSTTSRRARTGSAGPAPGTSCSPPAAAPAARASTPASSAPGTQASTRSSSRRVISPSSRSTSPTPPRSTAVSAPTCGTTTTTGSWTSCRTGQAHGTYVIWRYERQP